MHLEQDVKIGNQLPTKQGVVDCIKSLKFNKLTLPKDCQKNAVAAMGMAGMGSLRGGIAVLVG